MTSLSHSKMDQRQYNKPNAEVRNVARYNRKQGDRDWCMEQQHENSKDFHKKKKKKKKSN